MEALSSYVSNINKCLQEILNIFNLNEITLNFNLLDQNGELDDYNLNDFCIKIPSYTIYKNQSFGELPIPIRKYYDFKGWYFNFEDYTSLDTRIISWSNEVVDYSKVLLDGNSVTIFAKWELKTIDVILDPCGGDFSIKSVQCKLFDNIYNKIASLQSPEKTFYIFNNWFDNFGNELSVDQILKPDVSTFFAQYSAKKCSLTFDYTYSNVGAECLSSSILFNSNVISNLNAGSTFNLISGDSNYFKDANISAVGYTFKGWSLTKDNPVTVFTVYMTNDITIYAYLEPYNYQIEYRYNLNLNESSPLFIQNLFYGDIKPLISYESLFNTPPETNFRWRYTTTSDKEYCNYGKDFTFSDQMLVTNLISSDTYNPLILCREDNTIPDISHTIPIIGVENLSKKTYKFGDPILGIDFRILFFNGITRHPSKIVPAICSNNTKTISCFYGDRFVTTEIETENVLDLVSVEVDVGNFISSCIYGEKINLSSISAIEKYNDGSTKIIKYSDFPTNFITYPDKNSILTENGTIYFGYRSDFNNTVWPHNLQNDMLWDWTEISAEYFISNRDKHILIQQLPTKINYSVNDSLNLDGLVVFNELIDGTVVPLTSSEYTVSPKNETSISTLSGNNTLSVSLNNDSSISTTFQINILKQAPIGFEILGAENIIVDSNISSTELLNDFLLSRNSLSVKILNLDSREDEIKSFSEENRISISVPNSLSSNFGKIPINISLDLNNENEIDDPDLIFSEIIYIKKRFPDDSEFIITEFEIDLGILQNKDGILSLDFSNIKTLGNEIASFEYVATPLQSESEPESELESELSSESENTLMSLSGVYFTEEDSRNINKFNEEKSFVEISCGQNAIKYNYLFKIKSVNSNVQIYFDSKMQQKNSNFKWLNSFISKIDYNIPAYSFYNNTLDTITIGDKTNVIYDYAFYKDEKLAKIQIPMCVESIGKEAFSFCKNLSSIEFTLADNSDIPTIQGDTFGYDINSYCGTAVNNRTITVPSNYNFFNVLTSNGILFNKLINPISRNGYSYELSVKTTAE